MTNDDDKLRINPGYPFGQLVKALSGAGALAAARVNQWQQVLTGLLDGTLRVGSPTPVAGTPQWVTLDVVHGGFATGNLAAAGPLQAHEVETLASLSRSPKATDRAALNMYFLGDAGRSGLVTMLADGCYRVQVPEEAALLVAAWLIRRGEAERAGTLIEAITPFFDRLRFYPAPSARPMRSGAAVFVQTAGDSVKSLRAKIPQPSVQRMNESIQIWAPLYDRAVALFLETVEGEPPALQTTESGDLARGPGGQPIVSGGWPCRHYPDDWRIRARKLDDEYKHARAENRLCGKPDRPKENFARLRGYLAICVRDPAALTGRDVGSIRRILASCLTRHGAPGSSRLQGTRANQARDAARSPHHLIARVVVERLEEYPQDEGVPDLTSALAPVSPAGESLPDSIVAKTVRCLEAPIGVLIEKGVVTSSETMARVLPLLTARVRAAAIDDPELRRVYEAVYAAFRRRRTLLLLDLKSQVKLGELPWVAAVEPWVGSDQASRDAARTTLVQAATLAISAFPHTIVPNRLVKELRSLASAAEVSLPLVDELASDIFMGAFSENFLRAAQVSARVLRGTLYERYYGIPCDRVLGLDDVEKKRFGAPISPGFASLCEELAGATARGSSSVARNGTIIEQAQILTTHNLAALFNEFGLATSLPLPQLARQCFKWICRRQQMKINEWRGRLQMMKNSAYAWRQLVFFLSLVDAPEVRAFVDWSADYLIEQTDGFCQRFEPVVAGLRFVVAGNHFGADGQAGPCGRRFLGWSVERHWLLPPGNEIESARN